MILFEDQLRREKIALIWLYQTMVQDGGLTPAQAGTRVCAPAVVVAVHGAFSDWCAVRGLSAELVHQ